MGVMLAGPGPEYYQQQQLTLTHSFRSQLGMPPSLEGALVGFPSDGEGMEHQSLGQEQGQGMRPCSNAEGTRTHHQEGPHRQPLPLTWTPRMRPRR